VNQELVCGEDALIKVKVFKGKGRPKQSSTFKEKRKTGLTTTALGKGQ